MGCLLCSSGHPVSWLQFFLRQKRQELSREKLLSKMMMSIQAFTYSSCCEVNEARRLTRKAMAMSSVTAASMAGAKSTERDKDRILSKDGISEIICDEKLTIMCRPNALQDDGSQPFNERLGKRRYFGLAVMAAAGAVVAHLVQLSLVFPVILSADPPRKPYRAPIAYPILYGHILTHVVAAVCASAGRVPARSDSLEVSWPITFSCEGSLLSPTMRKRQSMSILYLMIRKVSLNLACLPECYRCS